MSEAMILTLFFCVILSYWIGYLRGKQVGLAISLKAFMGTLTTAGTLTKKPNKTLPGTLTLRDDDE